MKKAQLALVSLAAVLLVGSAHPTPRPAVWGFTGHQIVGRIAESYLTDEARAGIRALLGHEDLARVSTWADEVRGQPAYRWTAPLHYINVPLGEEVVFLDEDCPAGDCVVEAVRRFEAELRDTSLPRDEREEALKFLVHFVGDAHQPLHAGYREDRGGNDLDVRFFGTRRNLHQVWDSSLLDRRVEGSWTAYADELAFAYTDADVDYWQSTNDPEDWANESLLFAIDYAYAIPADGQLGDDYYADAIAIAEQQLVAAGVRLAALLNACFAGTVTGGAGGEDTILIATFNIQNLGRTKAGRPQVMAVLGEILRKYDVVAVQEIVNKAGVVPGQLLERVNADGSEYAMLVSPRTGVQDDDRSAQEQYAFYYDTTTIEPMDDGRLYDDGARDAFEREPWIARFGATEGDFSFVLITIHTKPTRAVEEIGALADVFAWARLQYPDEDDFIALGDYNASCSYATTAELDALALRGVDYTWVVPDDADTNLSTRSSCAYDRIVFGTGTLADWTTEWGVDRAFTDKQVSDHWPVWARFGVDEGGG